MIGLSESLEGNIHAFYARNAKIPIILSHMTPGNEVPVQRVKGQPNGFHLPDTLLFLNVFVADPDNGFVGNGTL